MILTIIIVLALVAGIIATRRNGDGVIKDFNARRTLPLRGIAALMVVIYHVSCNVREVTALNQFLCFGDMSVCLFFFISGYGLMISYINKGEDYLHGFVQHRFARLLPPFLIVAIGYEVYQSFQAGHSTLDSLTAIAHGGTVLPDSWFVITIMVYYLLFYACARLFRKPATVVLALWLASAGYIAMCYGLGWGNYWYKTACAINVGFTYALLEGEIKRCITAHKGMLVWASCAIAVAIIGLWATHVQLPIFYLMPLLVVAAVYAMGMWQSRVLDFLGTISYEIYLMQCIWRHKLFVTASIHWSVYLVLTLLITIVTAWLLHLLCKKLVNRGS